MSRLFLLRHAKAAWPQPGSRDFDRPIDETGGSDAAFMGQVMASSGFAPDSVVCSSALRARQTWEGLAPHLGTPAITFTDELYSTDPAGYVEVIRKTPDDGALLVIGHNPMMEELAIALAQDGDAEALAIASSGFPTCGLAVLRFAGPFATIDHDRGFLEAFLKPREN
jgi:phosphohistidine phosphatase